MEIGSKIRFLRTSKNLTLKQMADLVQLEKNKLSRFELGHQKPKLDDMEKIAKGMKIPIDKIETLDPERAIYNLHENSDFFLNTGSVQIPENKDNEALLKLIEVLKERLIASEQLNKSLTEALLKSQALQEAMMHRMNQVA
jgi:transcriptional regulator with XRE-family HTH domain